MVMSRRAEHVWHGPERGPASAKIQEKVPSCRSGRRRSPDTFYCVSTGLTPEQIASFIRDGFVRFEMAFPRELADQGRALLWAEMGLSPEEPSGWTEAVIRLPGSGAQPFKHAATTERLLLAFDQLVGQRRWVEPVGLGTFPIRFPNLPRVRRHRMAL